MGILALFGIFAWEGAVFRVCFYGVILFVGVAVGLEIPLLTRAIKRYGALRQVLSSVLAVDYGGALLASLVYPMLLYPTLGVARTAFVAGAFNLMGAALILLAFRRHRGRSPGLWVVVGVSTAAVVAGFLVSTRLVSVIDRRLYAPEHLVYAARSPYQHIAITRGPGGTTNLYLNGHLQFHTGDEARYHEPLVHVPMGLAAHRKRILVLGGGDGIALREILKYPSVESATLVDLDAKVTTLARTDPLLTAVNHHSFDNPKVHLITGDATAWLQRHPEKRFDVIICDFPDPSNPALARLYTVQFYRLVREHLDAGGVMVAQAGSPYFARRAYWCIVASVRAAGLTPLPYHVNVPSFGEWGYVAGRVGPPMDPSRLRDHGAHPLPRRRRPPGALRLPPGRGADPRAAPHAAAAAAAPPLRGGVEAARGLTPAAGYQATVAAAVPCSGTSR